MKCQAKKALITLNRTPIFEKYYDQIFYISKKEYNQDFYSTGIRDVYTKYGLLLYFDLVYSYYIKKYGE